MRQPRTTLPLVHAEPLEPTLHTVCERSGPSGRIREDEHPDRARLPIASRLENERLGSRGLPTQDVDDQGVLWTQGAHLGRQWVDVPHREVGDAGANGRHTYESW